MKKAFKVFIIAFLLCVFTYILKIDSIPESIVIYNGDTIDIGNLWGLKLKENGNGLLLASNNLSKQGEKVSTIDVKLFNLFTVKEVQVNALEEKTVIPVGQISGLKLYTNGVLVVGMSEVRGEDEKTYKPYETTKIEEGDRIIKINDIQIMDTKHLTEIVNNSNGKSLKIEFIKNNEKYVENITPKKTTDNKYKLGLWVRDSSAGIGTLTIYEPKTGKFAALGHGITDIDTGNLIEIQNGEFVTTNVVSIVKGEKGSPGKIQGSIDNSKTIGTIYKNTDLGIYGKLTELNSINIDFSKEMEIAKRDEINLGKATVLCNVDGDEIKEYDIEIQKVFINNNKDNKSMLIKVKDKELLQKTGGIIQGMSGSPIIQNGKFIGAITNVLVNDPTKGYAVFGDIMVSQMQ